MATEVESQLSAYNRELDLLLSRRLPILLASVGGTISGFVGLEAYFVREGQNPAVLVIAAVMAVSLVLLALRKMALRAGILRRFVAGGMAALAVLLVV